MKLPEGKSRLDLIKAGLGDAAAAKRGRLVVSIAKLVEDPNNERKTFRNMAGLVASIKAVGLVEPITVTPEEGVGSGTYRIVTGHRRFRAAKAAGLETVEVLIREPEEEHERRMKSLVSNVQREDIGPVEMAEALQSLLDEDERITSQRDLAHAIGKDDTWVSRMLRILDLPAPLQRKLATSQLSVPYDAVAAVARLTDAGQQEQLIGDLVSGATNRDIRQKVNLLKGRIAPEAGEKGGPSPSPKPKKVYHTGHKATVIVQSETKHLSAERVVEALAAALQQARRDAA